MSSSSSFVRHRCCRSSITDMSILQVESTEREGEGRVLGLGGEVDPYLREEGSGKPRERAPKERESSY